MGFDEKLVERYYATNAKEIEAEPDLEHLNLFVERFIGWSMMPHETCMICMEPMQQKVVLACSHAFCSGCMTAYLGNLINTRKVEKIPCMVEGCQYMLTKEEVKAVVRPEQFAAYQRFVRNSELSRNPNLRWCTSPRCEGYVLRVHDQKKLTCECGQQICFDCGQSWHERSCQAEFRQQYGKIVDSMHLQKCPKCGLHVEKVSGCNHMRCTKCSYQYCWLCLGRYTDHHYRWWNLFGCPKQQNAERYWRGWKYLFIVGFLPMLVLALLAFLVVSVVIAVVGGIVGPVLLIRRLMGRSIRIQHKWCRVVIWLLLLALALVLYPISCLLFWVPGSCIITFNFLRRMV